MNIFTFIKAQIPILTVISEYTALKRVGGYWKGQCPFHNERTGSFTVSPHKDIYYCFGCHQGGDVVDFIAQIENCSQKEAAYYLSERYALKLPTGITLEKSDQTHDKKQYEKLCALMSIWCHKNLLDSSRATLYLKNRSLTQTSIETFKLGFFPAGPHYIQQLLEYCKKEGFLKGDLINTHFLLEGKTLYSSFENRLIIPIKNYMGNYCGFGGRIFLENDERAKYYNSHEHTFFNKGILLFGLDIAKKEIQLHNNVFLVEGYFDCIAMHQAHYKNTVATLGTACTLEHLKLLMRYTQQITVMYDGDSAGQKAIFRLAQLCWHVDLTLFVIQLPLTEDPASYLAKMPSLEELLPHRKDIFLFCLENLGIDSRTKSLPERLMNIRHFLKLIAPLNQPLKQDLLLQKAAEVFDLPFDSLKSEFIHITTQKSNFHTPRAEIPVQKDISLEIPLLEKKIFCAILKTQELPYSEYLEFLDYTLEEPLKSLINKLITYKKNHEKISWFEFLELLNLQEKQLTSRLVLESETWGNDPFNTLFNQFFKKQWKIAVNDVKLKLVKAQQAGSDITEIRIILEDFQNFKQKLLKKGLICQ